MRRHATAASLKEGGPPQTNQPGHGNNGSAGSARAALMRCAQTEAANPSPALMPRLIRRFWTIFVIGILAAAAAFVITTWNDLDRSATRHLAFAASMAARQESAYLYTLAGQLSRLRTAVAHRRLQARIQALLTGYHTRHPQDAVAVIKDRLQTDSAGMHWTAATRAALGPIDECAQHAHTCLSIPIIQGREPAVWLAQSLGPDRILLLVEPLAAGPGLDTFWHFAPPGTRLFLLNPAQDDAFPLGATAPALSRPLAIAGKGPLGRALKSHPHHPAGIFQDLTGRPDYWRLGAYHRSAYGFVVAASVPLRTLLATLAHRLEIPLTLIALLLAMGTLYHRSAGIELHRAQTARTRANEQLRIERAFAEQQQDFYQALSELTRLIAHDPAPGDLFCSACRIIIAYTDLLFVWAGEVEPSGHIRVVSYAEKEALGVDWSHLYFSSDPTRPEGQGPAGRCVRSGQIEISENMRKDRAFTSWRGIHDTIGTGSAAAVPILRKGRVTAMLAFGSRQPSMFSPLIHLLDRLAKNIEFSLDNYERAQTLRYQTHHDVLTGLYNRSYFYGELARHLSETPDVPLAIAIFDLDNFKITNDQYGHQIGDQVLQQISQRLRALLPPQALAARLGGDEFAVILRGMATRQEILDTLDTMRGSLEPPYAIGGNKTVRLTATIGLAIHPDDGAVATDLIRRADLALYNAKTLGHNSLVPFRSEFERQLVEHRELQERFLRDLEQQRLTLHFQPQVEIATGHVRSAEALIRWPQPDGAIWVPGRYFAAITHNMPLMRALDLFVVRETLAAIGTLGHNGYPLPIAANIHSENLLHAGFAQDLCEILAAHPDLSRALEIEVTESSQIVDLESASRTLAACRGLGVTIALDDFGTGYASLNYLQKLPCDYIKIDRTFVDSMASEVRNFAIVSSTIAAAAVLGIPTVAEGVESVEQGLLLRDLGCRYAQGYVISRPLPLADLQTWIAAWRAPAEWTEHDRGPGHAGLWRARAGHSSMINAARRDLEQGNPARPPASACDCPLDGWLSAHVPGSLLASEHIRAHVALAAACRAETPELPKALEGLRRAEEDLNELLLGLLSTHKAGTDGGP